MDRITISDPTLRDGNHAVKHQMSLANIKEYCKRADTAGIDIIEVGHGNGLGASSLQLGTSLVNDIDLLMASREVIKKGKLGIHIIPGFGRIKDLESAIDIGVDVFRVATHCAEANTAKQMINFLKENKKIVFGVLMMSHMISKEGLLSESKKLFSYGVDAIIIMDSAGVYLPIDVKTRIDYLLQGLSIPIGFHGHNNLGCAIANSIAAVEIGASIVDGTIKGFGAGAGNTQLEVLLSVFEKLGYKFNVDLSRLFELVNWASDNFAYSPVIENDNIFSGLFGVFSGFSKHVQMAAKKFNVDPYDIYKSLGDRKVIAGQEDIVIEIAYELHKEKKK